MKTTKKRLKKAKKLIRQQKKAYKICKNWAFASGVKGRPPFLAALERVNRYTGEGKRREEERRVEE
jgi:hypothetical protein